MFVPPVATQGIAHKKTHVNLDYRAPNALRVSRTRLLGCRRLDLPAACSAQTMAACTLFVSSTACKRMLGACNLCVFRQRTIHNIQCAKLKCSQNKRANRFCDILLINSHKSINKLNASGKKTKNYQI
jgi:hypothetical protein